MAIYLCRKNLGVAIPLLQDAFHVGKEEVGTIASVGTAAYAVGKFLNGPVVDRIGGRKGFIAAMLAVAAFGAASALSPSLGILAALYGMNRFAGAAAWGAMVKVLPTWFAPNRAGTVLAVLSLSYVFGGIAALLFARQILGFGGGWRAIMGAPSLVVVGLLAFAARAVRPGPRSRPAEAAGNISLSVLRDMLTQRTFLVTCGISFVVTLMREAFNVWSVDFLTKVQGDRASVMAAALHSVAFDLAGAAAIIVNGVFYDRLGTRGRRLFLFGDLALLALLLLLFPAAAGRSLWMGSGLLAAVGLLVYGPFSLLSGVIAVEAGGEKAAATAAGFIDGVGYIAAVLSGSALGWVLDVGGYGLGFRLLAGLSAVAALLALL